jgi:hypothetical protein
METRYLLIISIFTGVATVALVIQTIALVGMFNGARAIRRRLMELADRTEPIVDSTRRLVEETRQHARDVFGRVHDITEATRAQVVKVDGLLNEVTLHTRANLERIDRMAAEAAERVEETMTEVQRTILTPIRGINGAAAAVRAVVGHLARRRTTMDGRPTQEEDLFI